jgi:hypothetical protein
MRSHPIEQQSAGEMSGQVQSPEQGSGVAVPVDGVPAQPRAARVPTTALTTRLRASDFTT